jgi:hypothetical protein
VLSLYDHRLVFSGYKPKKKKHLDVSTRNLALTSGRYAKLSNFLQDRPTPNQMPEQIQRMSKNHPMCDRVNNTLVVRNYIL